MIYQRSIIIYRDVSFQHTLTTVNHYLPTVDQIFLACFFSAKIVSNIPSDMVHERSIVIYRPQIGHLHKNMETYFRCCLAYVSQFKYVPLTRFVPKNV